jgi:hypothetical protein
VNELFDKAGFFCSHQGARESACLGGFSALLIAARSCVIWVLSSAEIAQGFEVESEFRVFSFQDSTRTRRHAGPTSWSVIAGPHGSSVFTGRPGQQKICYKHEDPESGILKDHTTTVASSERTLENGVVHQQTPDEKLEASKTGDNTGVQTEIGWNGMPHSTNTEMIFVGKLEERGVIECAEQLGALSVDDWTVEKVHKSEKEVASERAAEEERQRLRVAEQIELACENVLTFSYFLPYSINMLGLVAKPGWKEEATRALETAKSIKNEAIAEEWTFVGEKEPAGGFEKPSPEELANFIHDDLSGDQDVQRLYGRLDFHTLSDEYEFEKLRKKREYIAWLLKIGEDLRLYDASDVEEYAKNHVQIYDHALDDFDEGHALYRSCGANIAEHLTEANLGVQCSGRSLALTNPDFQHAKGTPIAATAYVRWACEFGKAPDCDCIMNMVKHLLDSTETCRALKSSEGFFESRHSEEAQKKMCGKKGKHDEHLLSSYELYGTKAEDLASHEDLNDDDDANVSLQKAQKLKSTQSPQSPM